LAAVSADLSITKTDGAASVTAGTATTYTMVVTNNGPDAAPNVTLTDTLPAQMTFNAVSAPAGWSCTTPAVGVSGTVSCSTASMASGVTDTFALSVTVGPSTPAGSIANTASVSSGASDPVIGNNSATDNDAVVTAPVAADLTMVKTNNVTQLASGGATVYTLTVTNLGPDEVSGAVVTDLAPAGLTFGAWTCTVTNPGSGGTVTTACVTGSGAGNVGASVNMKAGAVLTFSVPATVAANAYGAISNTASVSVPAGVSDPVPDNNAGTDTDAVSGESVPPTEVPTLSQWALILLSMATAAMASWHIRGRAARPRRRQRA